MEESHTCCQTEKHRPDRAHQWTHRWRLSRFEKSSRCTQGPSPHQLHAAKLLPASSNQLEGTDGGRITSSWILLHLCNSTQCQHQYPLVKTKKGSAHLKCCTTCLLPVICLPPSRLDWRATHRRNLVKVEESSPSNFALFPARSVHLHYVEQSLLLTFY